MSPTKTKMSPLARLEELRGDVRLARHRADELEAQARGAGRRRDAAAAALRTFYAGQEAGDEPDKAREQKLRADFADLEGRLEARSTLTRGHQVTTYHDPETDGRAQAARDQADRAAGQVDAFIGDHRTDLQGELVERSIAAGDRIMAALGELADADGAMRSVRNQWGTLNLAELGELPTPLNLDDALLVYAQVQGGAKDPRGIFPMPPHLAPGGENEERDAPPLRGWERHPIVVSSMHGLGTP